MLPLNGLLELAHGFRLREKQDDHCRNRHFTINVLGASIVADMDTNLAAASASVWKAFDGWTSLCP
jgi:hypothetical protein